MSSVLRLGTRASQLALTQSGWVAERVRSVTGRDVELVPLTTTGDVTAGSLAGFGGTGVFATELRQALLDGACDLVVHSLKDLPTATYPDLVIAAVPERERPADALCAATGEGLDRLSPGARVGTGSPRRAAQVRRARPDLVVDDIRGNVDSRLAKVAEGGYDAVVLAVAGLRRLGREAEIAEEFEISAWPTSAGQGALAVECREADHGLRDELAPLTHDESRVTSGLEREVLRQLEAGCSAPVGIAAWTDGAHVTIVAEVYPEGPVPVVRARRSVAAADVIGIGVSSIAAGVIADLVASGLDTAAWGAGRP